MLDDAQRPEGINPPSPPADKYRDIQIGQRLPRSRRNRPAEICRVESCNYEGFTHLERVLAFNWTQTYRGKGKR